MAYYLLMAAIVYVVVVGMFLHDVVSMAPALVEASARVIQALATIYIMMFGVVWLILRITT